MNLQSAFRFAAFPFLMHFACTSSAQDAFFKLYNIWRPWNDGPIKNFAYSDSTLITAFSYYPGLLLIKTNYDGHILWARIDSSNRYENRFECFGIRQCRDGNLIAYGSRAASGIQYDNATLLKIDSGGNVLWNKTYVNMNTPGFYLDTTSDNGFIFSAGFSGQCDPCFSDKTDPSKSTALFL